VRYILIVHIISRKILRDFWLKHPDSEMPLKVWFKKMSNHDYVIWHDLRRVFPVADKVADKVVFNIGGNKYRLIASVHFNRRKVYIRHILTHREYDRGGWKNG